MNYYGNPYNSQMYMQDLASMRDRIDQQMRQMQQQPTIQPQAQAPITQNFQLAPQNNGNTDIESKIVKDVEDVKNTFVLKLGAFITADYSTLFIKDSSGNIREFKTQEVIEMDERDKQIADLQKQKEDDNATILMLKKEIENIKNSIQTSIVPSVAEEKLKTTKGANK